jgi:hypothetical protein
MFLNRRHFLRSLICAAPAVVAVGNLMPIRAFNPLLPSPLVVGFLYTDESAEILRQQICAGPAAHVMQQLGVEKFAMLFGATWREPGGVWKTWSPDDIALVWDGE